MATGQDRKAGSISDVDLLLHPELLSQDFMQMILNEKKVSTRDCTSRDRLTELYLHHVIPLPQRTLPNSRWGQRVQKTRGTPTMAGHRADSTGNDHNRKRPLIVFDGSSSHSGLLKVKKPEGSTGITDRLKPPPAANLSNPIRKLSGNTSSSSSSIQMSACNNDTANLKREANSSGLKSPEVKKKIQHVTWP
ncbi:ashwin [Scomber scombrus]|nr:ashwin [Scomber scombrus]